jgi:hypothetical protein
MADIITRLKRERRIAVAIFHGLLLLAGLTRALAPCATLSNQPPAAVAGQE